ncbi:MAG: 2OG-Fe(II) oxygenase [Microthrixaceae bacterium]|nr:2OG-Fe(II) oxygenase [Microthrixaceae bacterium]
MDHFTQHVDAGAENSTRKLSFSLQLSDGADYRGGDLIFGGVAGLAKRGRGWMTVFPSILAHEVTPTIAGRRFAVVGWIHGPAFR